MYVLTRAPLGTRGLITQKNVSSHLHRTLSGEILLGFIWISESDVTFFFGVIKSNARRLEMKRLDASAQNISIDLSDGILFRGMESLWLCL